MADTQLYLTKFLEKIESEFDIETLYKEEVKQKSFYNDYSKILLEHDVKNLLNKIKPNEVREESYWVETHKGITESGKIKEPKFQWEVRECLAIFNYFTNHPASSQFKIIDYQMPLKNTNKDNEKGVDLIGSNSTDIFLLEFKRFNSDESLLRSALEIYTYRKLLENAEKKVCTNYNHPNGKLIPAILLMEGSKQHKAWISNTNDAPIKKLIQELQISVFLIKPNKPFFENKDMKKLLASSKPEFDFDLTIEKV